MAMKVSSKFSVRSKELRITCCEAASGLSIGRFEAVGTEASRLKYSSSSGFFSGLWILMTRGSGESVGLLKYLFVDDSFCGLLSSAVLLERDLFLLTVNGGGELRVISRSACGFWDVEASSYLILCFMTVPSGSIDPDVRLFVVGELNESVLGLSSSDIVSSLSR